MYRGESVRKNLLTNLDNKLSKKCSFFVIAEFVIFVIFTILANGPFAVAGKFLVTFATFAKFALLTTAPL